VRSQQDGRSRRIRPGKRATTFDTARASAATAADEALLHGRVEPEPLQRGDEPPSNLGVAGAPVGCGPSGLMTLAIACRARADENSACRRVEPLCGWRRVAPGDESQHDTEDEQGRDRSPHGWVARILRALGPIAPITVRRESWPSYVACA
jgi:hypothetical protein